MSTSTYLSLYRRMIRIRYFEEKIVELYPAQQMRCPVHLSIGQEAAAAGVCEALSKDDPIFCNHRAHAHYIAKGGSLNKMMAELYGKATGCCGGVGGSMHVVDPSSMVMATVPIVAGILPIAVGAALAYQMDNRPNVVTVFLGDAAVEEGTFHESINFANLRRLRVIFFCENNLYSVYTPLEKRQPCRPIENLASGHGVKTLSINGNNVLDVYKATEEALLFTREERKPIFIEAKTYRWREHCGPNYDNDIGYRTKEEFLFWQKQCPIENFKQFLLGEGGVSIDTLRSIENETRQDVKGSHEFALESPLPLWESLNLYAE